MRLIFVRHGEPDYALDSLTEKGFREAEALSRRCAKWDVTKVFCSPLGRARATAAPSLKLLKQAPEICQWLREFSELVRDPVTGKSRICWDFMPGYWTRFPQMYDSQQWVHAPVMETGEIEKNYHEVIDGLDGVLRRYGYQRSGHLYQVLPGAERDATLVFFCHLGLTMTALSHLLGIAQPLLTHGFFLAPSSVTVLASEERADDQAYFRVQVMGDTSHLAQCGEPVSKAGYFTDPFQG